MPFTPSITDSRIPPSAIATTGVRFKRSEAEWFKPRRIDHRRRPGQRVDELLLRHADARNELHPQRVRQRHKLFLISLVREVTDPLEFGTPLSPLEEPLGEMIERPLPTSARQIVPNGDLHVWVTRAAVWFLSKG